MTSSKKPNKTIFDYTFDSSDSEEFMYSDDESESDYSDYYEKTEIKNKIKNMENKEDHPRAHNDNKNKKTKIPMKSEHPFHYTEYDNDDDDDAHESFSFMNSSKINFNYDEPFGIDLIIKKTTKMITYAFIVMIVFLLLLVLGGIFMTFIDKWHEETQNRDIYYLTVMECEEKEIQSEQIMQTCMKAKKELSKSILFGTIKSTFFELVQSLDDCVWYLKSSPAAWLVFGCLIFILVSKLLWTEKNEDDPNILKWIKRIGMMRTNKGQKRKKKRKKQTHHLKQYKTHLVPKCEEEYRENLTNTMKNDNSMVIPFENENKKYGMRHRFDTNLQHSGHFKIIRKQHSLLPLNDS